MEDIKKSGNRLLVLSLAVSCLALGASGLLWKELKATKLLPLTEN